MDKLDGYLRKHSYRVTPQRRVIYECLIDSKEHPTAEMLYEQIKEQHPSMSLNTVYNTLELFENLGLIMRVFPESHSARYDGNVKPHIHLVCMECGEVFDFDDEVKVDLEGLKEQVQRATRFNVQQENILLCGTCEKCYKQNLKEEFKNGTKRK